MFLLIVADLSVISDGSDVYPVQSVYALEGDNVTLKTKEELPKLHNVTWLQGKHCDGKLLAQREKNVTFINYGFKGVVQLNPHTGSLTFIRATKRFTGFYCVKLQLGKDPHIIKRYWLIVYGKCSVW